MPRLTRGFWVCSHCENPFIECEDAKAHEAVCDKATRTYSFLGTRHPALSHIDLEVGNNLEFAEINDHVCLRCASCHVYSTFPRRISEIPSCFRHMQAHLSHCLKNSDCQRLFEQAMNISQERSFAILTEFVAERCSQLEIINKSSGIGLAQNPDDRPIPLNEVDDPLPVIDDEIQIGQDDVSGCHAQPFPSTRGSYDATHEETELMPVYEIPENFPFLQDPSGMWLCKYCYNIPMQHRDPHFWWHVVDGAPPPVQLIDQHMSICRGYIMAMHQQIAVVHTREPYVAAQHGPLLASETDRDSADRDMDTKAGPTRSSIKSSKPLPLGNRKRRAPSPATSTAEQGTGNSKEHEDAIKLLEQNDVSMIDSSGKHLPESHRLVVEEDKLLLTDYFYHLMKQLKLVHFSEKDRRTRGGKRESIKVGYAGLQCAHCADQTGCRKFFWSNVDRLANSFAEIPAHIFKCKSCPESSLKALQVLKRKHAEQMSQLPRGSQKIFFRRVWRRLHSGDTSSPYRASVASRQASSFLLNEIFMLSERNAAESASVLRFGNNSFPGRPLRARVVLGLPSDKDFLSDNECCIRRNVEVFCCTKKDVEVESMLNNRVVLGQVGLRCLYCDLFSHVGSYTHFPPSIHSIYDCVREALQKHMLECKYIPSACKEQIRSSQEISSLTSVVKSYYKSSAKALGLCDASGHIIAGAEPEPITPTAALIFARSSSSGSSQGGGASNVDAEGHFDEASRSPSKSETHRKLDL